MTQLSWIGLSWPLTKPPFGSCAIYFHYGVIFGSVLGEITFISLTSWESKVPPPKATPPINKALLRDYLPLVSLNKALLGPYFLGGVALGGGTLDSHDNNHLSGKRTTKSSLVYNQKILLKVSIVPVKKMLKISCWHLISWSQCAKLPHQNKGFNSLTIPILHWLNFQVIYTLEMNIEPKVMEVWFR